MFITTAFIIYRLGLFWISLVQEADSSDFNDLGKLLLGGVVLAIVIVIAFTVLRQRLQDKKPPVPSVISINSFQKKDPPKDLS
jgi:hypothetical protein